MKISRKNKGFTMLEILIVIGIILTLSAIFTTGYTQYVAKQRVKNSIRNILVLKKALNNMATICRGLPEREDPSDMNELLPIIDLTECKGASAESDDINPKVFPTGMECPQESLGDEILRTYSKTTLPQRTHSSSLCRSACDIDDVGCLQGREPNFHQTFVTVPEESVGGCSPDYGSPSGSEFASLGEGSYHPGWNYALLNDASNTIDQPVGVICGVSLGYKTAVKIVINTAGFYGSAACGGNNNGEVPEGVGCYDIDGTTLPNRCPCGPWCEELATGRSGCCHACEDKSGLGYKYQ